MTLNSRFTIVVRFRQGQLVEVIRALELAIEHDEQVSIHIDRRARCSKQTALARLRRALTTLQEREQR